MMLIWTGYKIKIKKNNSFFELARITKEDLRHSVLVMDKVSVLTSVIAKTGPAKVQASLFLNDNQQLDI